MLFQERIYSVLIVSMAEKFSESLRAMLPVGKFEPIDTVKNIAAAKRAMFERHYDFVFINSPLPDEFGDRFAIDICTSSNSIALIFVKNDIYDEVYAKSVDYGVLTLPKPTSMQVVSQSVQMMCSIRERLRKLEKKTATIEDKIAEIRKVNQAKWILIEELKMSEEDAHKYIERQAMDRCVSKREIAEGIIKTYS